MAYPRQNPDAASRSVGADLPSARFDANAFADEFEAPVRRLTRDEAEAIDRREPPVSPWRVVAMQAAFGAVATLLVLLFTADDTLALSVLYGAAVVAIPGALMARGATGRVSSVSPLASTVSLMAWALLKLVASVALLAAAPRIVPGVSWPMLLASLVLCLQTYGVALLWRMRPA